MAEEIFFTADLHFGHKMMLKKDRNFPRPWASAEEMDEAIIENWNQTVRPPDRIYVLGDVSFRNNTLTVGLIGQLRGNIHLVRGNHDESLSADILKQFESVSHYKEARIAGTKIIMSHYALLTWNKMHDGAWNLHGHSHGSLAISETRKQMDVGIDSVALHLLGRYEIGGEYSPSLNPRDYRPISFEEIKEVMDAKKPFVPVDQHKPGYTE